MTVRKEFDCITVGDLFIDIVMSGFASLPRLGEEAFAEELRREVGGGAAITACGLARLGAQTSALALVGQSDGEWAIARLRSCGVRTDLTRFHLSEPTGLTVAVSTREDRAFFTYAGANAFLNELLGDPQIHRQLARARHVHVAMPMAPALLRRLAGAVHEAGGTLSLDVGWQPAWLEDERSLDALREIDLFLPNEREAERMTGQTSPEEMLRSFAAAGVPGVALKLGPRGAMLLRDGKILASPPHPVVAIDSTGAGDCFDAGFLHGLLQGAPPEECLRLGNRCGALSTRALGGLAAFPHLDELF
ncbi:MAG: carbohydrate kinase family protein [Blastocatellia bacterium]|nr:carbohydrate kinase family protein [Blastocatellia bacterium]